MTRVPTWKWVIAAGSLFVALAFLIVPKPGSGVGFPTINVNLGLDLRGGVHMGMEVQTDDAVRTEVDAAEGRLRQALRDRSIPFERVERPAVNQLRLVGLPETARTEAREVLEDELRDWALVQESAGFLARMGAGQESSIREQAVADVLAGIRDRVDRWGVAEPNIQRQGITGSDRILVQLPGIEDPERVKDLLTEPAFLEWKLLVYPPNYSQGIFSGAVSREQLLSQFGGVLPDGTEIYPQAFEAPDGTVTQLFWPLQKISVITGNDLEDAQGSTDQFGKPAVRFRLEPSAGQRFGKLTRENVGRQMAILLDEEVISAPRIDSEIPGGSGIITGSFTTQSANDLAFKLRSGALRAGVTILEERSVGPSLGADSIRKGLVSGSLGFVLVMLFAIAWYHLSGLNAVTVLLLNVVIILGIMAAFDATLTLPGIAGYILTVGMAVDANVLIFERIREELRLGKTVRSAVDGGYNKAFWTIVDSNLTTLIAAVALLSYGTGPIKGFALILMVGLLANLFTAVFVSRLLFELYLGRSPRVEHLSI